MQRIEYEDPNNNAQFVIDKISEVQNNVNDSIWLVSDLELIPLQRSDFDGIGKEPQASISYQFYLKVLNEKMLLSYREIINILKDTRTIGNAVIMCFNKDDMHNFKSFQPKVEDSPPEAISHEDAIFEIRILDGDLFYIFYNQKY